MKTASTLLVLGCAFAVAACTAAPAAVTSPLETLNQDFRSIYAQARAHCLAVDEPYLVVSFGRVELHLAGKVTAADYTPALYHQYKRVAHAVLSVYSLAQVCSDPLTANDVAQVEQYLAHLRSARTGLGEEGFPRDALERQQRILDGATQCLQSVRQAHRVDRSQLEAALRAMAPDVMENVAAAARAQLDDLNGAVSKLTGGLDAGQRRAIHVVVLGTHQARDGYLQMQYFRKAMAEAGPVEDRLVFCEVEFSQQQRLEDKAVHLLGTHLLDESASAAIFADRGRLESDILAEAAAHHLAGMSVPMLR